MPRTARTPLHRFRNDATLGTLVLVLACISCFRFESVAEEHWHRWRSSKIKNYRYQLDRICFPSICPKVVIEVRDDRPVSVVDSYTGAPIVGVELDELEQYLTIDRLFEMLTTQDLDPPAHIKAEYDEVLGYPLRVAIVAHPFGFDTDTAFVITEFSAVRGPGGVQPNSRLNPPVGPVTGLANDARPAPVPPAG